MKQYEEMSIDPRQEWRTPTEFISAVKSLFGELTCDVAATRNNALAPIYFGPDHEAVERRDGLSIEPWCVAGWNWCNPGFGQLMDWSCACHRQLRENGCKTIMLGLADCSTEWFQFCVENANKIILLAQRIHFVPAPGIKASSNSRPNALFIWGGPFPENLISYWRRQ